MNETILQALALIPSLIFAIVFHEVSHGLVARMLGDPTAERQRRLTLNPLRHVDPVGTVILPGLLALAKLPVFGWAKPVPVNPRLLRNPRYGMMAVAAAGPLSNLILAAFGAVALGLMARSYGMDEEPVGAALFAATALNYFVMVNVFLAFFNLLPLPPFDGSHIVEGLLPRGAALQAYQRLRPFGMLLFFGLLLVVPYLFPQANIIERLVLPPVQWMLEHYLALAGAVSES